MTSKSSSTRDEHPPLLGRLLHVVGHEACAIAGGPQLAHLLDHDLVHLEPGHQVAELREVDLDLRRRRSLDQVGPVLRRL